MSDPGRTSFAEHVHEIVVLARQGAPRKSIRARVDSMHLDLDEHAALLALAESLRESGQPRRRTRTRGHERPLTHA
jgi:hypothetical protein